MGITRRRPKAGPYYGKITRGEYPCICAQIPGLHRHLIKLTSAYMPEAELLRITKMICTVYNVYCIHERDSRQQEVKGVPDLIMAGKNGTLWRELKSHYGSLSPEQRRFGSVLTHAGEDWAVWRPVDLINATIETKIARIA